MTLPVADQQILRGAAGTLAWQYLDADGEAADPGTVTVGVTRADGTVLVAGGAATGGTGATPRTLALTAAQTAQLDTLAVTWTRTDSTTYPTVAEIVGGYYFTVAQLRVREKSLADNQKYLTADLQAQRRDVEDEFESICGVAFVPRHRRQRLNGTGGNTLLLPMAEPRRIVSVQEVDANGATTTWSGAEIAAIRIGTSPQVVSPLRTFTCGALNLIVTWEHGYDRPLTDVRDKAMLRLRYNVIRPNSAVPDRASSFQVEGGNVYRLDTAKHDRTGIPEVDAVLTRRSRQVGVA